MNPPLFVVGSGGAGGLPWGTGTGVPWPGGRPRRDPLGGGPPPLRFALGGDSPQDGPGRGRPRRWTLPPRPVPRRPLGAPLGASSGPWGAPPTTLLGVRVEGRVRAAGRGGSEFTIEGELDGPRSQIPSSRFLLDRAGHGPQSPWSPTGTIGGPGDHQTAPAGHGPRIHPGTIGDHRDHENSRRLSLRSFCTLF